MIYRTVRASGFSLAEIIISTLLLSVFTLGSFKAFHYAQHTSNSALTQFLSQNQDNLRSVLEKLVLEYPAVRVDPDFTRLKCLIEQISDCPPIPQ